MQLRPFLWNVIGWYGTVAVLLGYVLVSLQLLASASIQFQLLNLTGATCLALFSWHKQALQLTILNAIWASIALISIAIFLA